MCAGGGGGTCIFLAIGLEKVIPYATHPACVRTHARPRRLSSASPDALAPPPPPPFKHMQVGHKTRPQDRSKCAHPGLLLFITPIPPPPRGLDLSPTSVSRMPASRRHSCDPGTSYRSKREPSGDAGVCLPFWPCWALATPGPRPHPGAHLGKRKKIITGGRGGGWCQADGNLTLTSLYPPLPASARGG